MVGETRLNSGQVPPPAPNASGPARGTTGFPGTEGTAGRALLGAATVGEGRTPRLERPPSPGALAEQPPRPPPRFSMNLLNERDVTNAFRKKLNAPNQRSGLSFRRPPRPPRGSRTNNSAACSQNTSTDQ